MARIAATVAVIFFFFVFSEAYVSTDDFPRSESSWVLTESDSEAAASGTILLPIEKPDGQVVANLEWKEALGGEQLSEREVAIGKLPEIEVKDASKSEPETKIDGAKLPEPDVLEPVEEAFSTIEQMPLTVVTFRPINRHFRPIHDRRPLPFLKPHRCRHHHFKPMGPRFVHREIPYGNDMIMAKGDREEGPASVGPVFRGERLRRLPSRWMKLHHRGPKIPMRHEEFSGENFKPMRPQVEEENMDRTSGEKKEHGGFFKGIRKFLNGF